MIFDLDKLAIVDVETTGTRSGGVDRVIEIGIVLVDQGKVSQTFSSLINPNRGVNPYIFQMTGISPYALAEAPEFASLADQVWEMLTDRIFVAHNARFDYGFLKSEFGYLDRVFQSKHLCTVQLSRRLFPEYKRHGLSSIIERLGIAVESRHRALDDALAVWEFLESARSQLGIDQVIQTAKAIIKKPALPIHIHDDTINRLPECPGVYIFKDQEGQVLYVGKSIHIKDRVKSHFYSDLHNPTELKIKQAVSEIETITTAGELEALLLESKLIKDLQPIFNVKLRRNRSLHVARLEENQSGFLEIKTERSQMADISVIQPSLAIFKTKRELTTILRKVTKDHLLCNKLMGLEHTSSSCFGYRLRQCLGACVGKEPQASYNLRVQKAFSKLQIPSWDFAEPVAITEHNSLTGETAKLWFDQWCYLGKTSIEENQPPVGGELQFDYDSYIIIRRFFKDRNIVYKTKSKL